MTLGQLRTFLAVARTGSVRGAAESLFVSEPSVSAAIAALEREIGAELLERQGRGVRLTAAGEALARYASDALGTLEQGIAAARHEARPGTGRLRLVSVTTAGEHIVPVLLEAYRRRYPEVEPILEVGNRSLVLDRLASRDADLGIGGRPPGGRGITGTKFAPNELIVVASGGHDLAGRRTVAAEDLSAQTWLLREQGSGTRTTTEEFLSSVGIVPKAVLTLGSNGAVKQAAAVGLGVTLISTAAVAVELRAGMLATVRGPGLPLARAWYALQVERSRLPGPARSFAEFLRSPSAAKALGAAGVAPAVSRSRARSRTGRGG